jgi:phage terminase small subunit
MTQGSRTPEATRAAFRAHYLYSGVAAQSARHVGIPESTGADLARELSKEPDFVEARRELRVQYLDEHVAMRMRVAQKALERFEGDLMPSDFVGGEENITIIDKRADYGKLVIEAEKVAHNLAKIESDSRQQVGVTATGPVTIVVRGPGGEKELGADESAD